MAEKPAWSESVKGGGPLTGVRLVRGPKSRLSEGLGVPFCEQLSRDRS
jgi:hypothetical protein